MTDIPAGKKVIVKPSVYGYSVRFEIRNMVYISFDVFDVEYSSLDDFSMFAFVFPFPFFFLQSNVVYSMFKTRP